MVDDIDDIDRRREQAAQHRLKVQQMVIVSNNRCGYHGCNRISDFSKYTCLTRGAAVYCAKFEKLLCPMGPFSSVAGVVHWPKVGFWVSRIDIWDIEIVQIKIK